MDDPITRLSTLEYPGRLIAIGAPEGGGKAAIIYAITGRSPSSQARKLVLRDSGIWVEPTDEETLRKGNVDLLVYPAVLFGQAGVAVSNGKQTSDIQQELLRSADPVAVLSKALAAWDFEPDTPIYTPRISGCLSGAGAALSVLRRGPAGETRRSYFEVALREGEGRFVSTYEGPNADPLPVFRGEPRRIRWAGATAADSAESAYHELGPAAAGPDFRVAVACVFVPITVPVKMDVRIINRHERT